jgi:hypothetical protein
MQAARMTIMKSRTKIIVASLILVTLILLYYLTKKNADNSSFSEHVNYAESVSPQRLAVDLSWYRLYHPESSDADLSLFVKNLFALWVFSPAEFKAYCDHFPEFLNQETKSQFNQLIFGDDVLDTNRFGPVQIIPNAGRLNYFVKGSDRDLWIESFEIKNGEIYRFQDKSHGDLMRNFLDDFARDSGLIAD